MIFFFVEVFKIPKNIIYLLLNNRIKCCCLVASVMSDSVRPYGLQPSRLRCPWASPGKQTGVGCYALLRRIFPAQGLNPGLLHCRKSLYHSATREHMDPLHPLTSLRCEILAILFLYILMIHLLFHYLLFHFLSPRNYDIIHQLLMLKKTKQDNRWIIEILINQNLVMMLKLIPWAKSQDWIFSSQYLKDKFSHTYTPISEQYIYNKKKETEYLFKKEGLHWTITCNKNLSEWQALSRVGLFATPWTVACEAPPPMGFSRQEYWSGLPFPSPGDLPDPGMEPGSPALQADLYHLRHQRSSAAQTECVTTVHFHLL